MAPQPSPTPPSLSDIMTAMSVMMKGNTPPPAAEEKGLAKHAATIVSAIILALCLWVGASMTGVGTTVTRIAERLDSVQKDVGDLKSGQTTATKDMADLKAAVAKQDARADAVEADVGRVKERVRLLEGQPPVHLQSARPEPF